MCFFFCIEAKLCPSRLMMCPVVCAANSCRRVMLSPPQLAGMLNQELKVCVGCIDISTTMHRFIVVLGEAAVHVDSLTVPWC